MLDVCPYLHVSPKPSPIHPIYADGRQDRRLIDPATQPHHPKDSSFPSTRHTSDLCLSPHRKHGRCAADTSMVCRVHVHGPFCKQSLHPTGSAAPNIHFFEATEPDTTVGASSLHAQPRNKESLMSRVNERCVLLGHRRDVAVES